jgi:hypothetical protein
MSTTTVDYSRNCYITFIANILFCIGSIVGLILWQINSGYYVLTSIYGFNWFVVVTSLLISILFIIVNILNNFKSFLLDNELIFSYALLFVSFGYTIFWLSISATESSYTRDCLYFKDYYNDYYNYYNYYINCTGLIITMVFAWLLFLTWTTTFILTCVYVYNKYIENNHQLYPRNNIEHYMESPSTVESTVLNEITIPLNTLPTIHETQDENKINVQPISGRASNEAVYNEPVTNEVRLREIVIGNNQ